MAERRRWVWYLHTRRMITCRGEQFKFLLRTIESLPFFILFLKGGLITENLCTNKAGNRRGHGFFNAGVGFQVTIDNYLNFHCYF